MEAPRKSLLVVYYSLLSIGAIGGFSAFYFTYHERFANRWQEAERRHNATYRAILERSEIAEQEKQQCLDDDTKDVEIGELRGRLGAQATLTDAHRQMQQDITKLNEEVQHWKSLREDALDQYDELHDELSKQKREGYELIRESEHEQARLQTQRDNDARTIQELNERTAELELEMVRRSNQVSDLNNELDALDARNTELANLAESRNQRMKELEAERDELQNQLNSDARQDTDLAAQLEERTQQNAALQERLAQQSEELQELKATRAELEEAVANLSAELGNAEGGTQSGDLEECETSREQIQTRVQQRHASMCKIDYGKGPYYVQFSVNLDGATDHPSFVVELASRKRLPHSVYTFLSLVEYDLFDGASFSMADGGVMGIAHNKDATKVNKKLQALGFGKVAVAFQEESDEFPCNDSSVGFAGLGPSLQVHISDDTSRSGLSCFGKVVRGMETLSLVQDSMAEGKTVDLDQVELLTL